MKTLVCTEPGKLEYAVAEKPALQKGQSIIKIKRIGICGTDLHAFEGTQPYFNYPRILGHELAGELVEFDSKTRLTIQRLIRASSLEAHADITKNLIVSSESAFHVCSI